MRELHPRIFIRPDDLSGNLVTIRGEDYRHLAHSLRLREGDVVRIGDGCGTTWRGEAISVNAEQVELRLSEKYTYQRDIPSIHLYQAITKGSKMDDIVRHNVELGADFIGFFQAEFSTYAPARRSTFIERAKKIALESAKQSRRPFMPEVIALGNTEQARSRLSDYELSVVAWERAGIGLSDALPETPPCRIAIIVGPEGGFSEDEMLKFHQAGARSAALGKNILRTETAGLVLQAAIRLRYGLL